MKKSNRIYWIIGVAVLVVVILAAIFGRGRTKTKEVDVELVEKRKIIETVSANGKIQPEIDVKISSEVSGKITKIFVKEGDHVKEGELLLTINPDILESTLSRSNAALNNSRAAVSTAKARLAQAEAQFINSEKEYKRSQQLFDQTVISQSEWDAATAAFEISKSDLEAAKQNVKASEYTVKSAEAARKEASDNLNRTKIFAPSNGTITALQVEEGETVLGTTMMTGTELLRVSNLDYMEVAVDVNESDIVKVNMNDTCLIEVDAYRNRKFKGIVTEIANTALNATNIMSSDQVTNFSVKVRILPDSYEDLLDQEANEISPFRSGMSATVDIQTNIGTDLITVPIEAVTTREDTARIAKGEKIDYKKRIEERKKNSKEDIEPVECVFLSINGEARLVPVKTGIQDNKYIQILEGVAEGDEVVIGPYGMVSRDLKNGDEIDAKNPEEEEEENENRIEITFGG